MHRSPNSGLGPCLLTKRVDFAANDREGRRFSSCPRKFLNPGATDTALVKVARVATVVLGVLAIGIAYLVPSVLGPVLYAYTFGTAGLFFPMLGLLFWPRTTATGAFWSMLLGSTCAIVWAFFDEPWGFASSYLGWAVALPVLVVVSLLSEHSAEEDLLIFRER